MHMRESPRQPSIQARLLDAQGRPSGFDYLRLILAISVLLSHTINICYGREFTEDIWSGPARPFLALILPMFFALSGFLVAGSFERCRTIISFGALRVLRIVPALAVDTAVSALLLGPLFTSLPLTDYFLDSRLHAYFLNVVGKIHYVLPGVFTHNPWNNFVNQQLWTLPYELLCYTILGFFAMIGIAQRPWIFLPLIIFLNLVIFFYYGVFGADQAPEVTVTGPILVFCFLFGVLGFLYREHIAWSSPLFFSSLAISLLCLYLPAGDFLAPLPATYVTIYLGLLNPPRNWIISSGDYSYGIFLYGFPVQQAVVAALGDFGRIWYVNVMLSLFITLALAIISWRAVEKPMLGFRKALPNLEDAMIKLAQKIPFSTFLVTELQQIRSPRSSIPSNS